MMEFYKNRPSNLSGERAAENISRAKFEEGDPEALKKADYLAYSYQQGRKAPGVVYNPDLAAYEESGGNINESLQHELSHVGFYNIPNLEKLKIHPVSPKEFSRRWSFKNEGDKVVPISKGDAMYYTRPNEIYARRKGTSDFFGLDMTKPVSDDDFNRMIKLRQTLDPSVTEEQYQELIKKDPKLGEEVERLKAIPGGNNILNFLNAMPDDVKKYRNIFNEVTAIPGEQAPVAQNGMTYYQHGLDWKPKSISKNGGWLDKYIPEAQDGVVTLRKDAETLDKLAQRKAFEKNITNQPQIKQGKKEISKTNNSDGRSFWETASQFIPVYEQFLDVKDIVQGAFTGDTEMRNRGIVGMAAPLSGKAVMGGLDYLTEKTQGKEAADYNENKRKSIINSPTFNRALFKKYGWGGYDKWVKDGEPPLYEQGGIIKDDRGQWAHPGEITEIGSNQITMQGVPYPVLGISDEGDTQMMYPEQEYKFKGKKVTEYPMAQKGRKVAPVYVNDPNDPRLKLYTDSLSTYNKSLNPWHWPGTKVTTKQDYEKKLKLQRDFPHWSFDEDQYKKDKKKEKFKDFNDYMYDVGMADKRDPKALDAFNRNTGKHFKDFEEPIEKKLPDGRIKQYWGTYKGKLDESHYTIYDPVTGSSSHYTHSGNDPDTFLGLFNPNIKPIGHIYHAFDQPYNTGETYISSEDSEYVNKVLKNKTKKKKNYINYTYGANDNEVYKEPVQPVIYNKKKYNPNDPRLKQLQESFDKFHSNIGKKSKEQPKKSEPKPEEPTLKKKVSKMEPIRSSYTPSLSLRTIQTPNIELPGIQMGDYDVSYYSPESKDWANRRFTSQEESDKFAQEMSQRGYPGSYGNVTQTKKINKKSTGGWLDKYN